jgi:hypothetical protein
MRLGMYRLSFAVGLLFVTGFVLAQAKPPGGFDRLKSLAGDWEGTNPKGKTVRATYSVVSGNTAVMETLNPSDEPGMITVFHPDGNQLMMTHYCSSGNQPRMRATASNEKELLFSFLDATNLSSPSAGHMQRLQIEFVDANHIVESWTWRENGEDKSEVFHFARRK